MDKHYVRFLATVKERVRKAQYAALKAVNHELIELYLDIGRMIVERQKKYGWGKSIVENLAKDLQKEFPGMQGFSASNLWRSKLIYEQYSKNTKLAPLVREIGWSHNLCIFEKCKDELEREFYIRMTRKFGWTKNVLIHQIENKTYGKTLLNQTNFNKTIPSDMRTQAKLAVKDEYTFDFLDLGEEHKEGEGEGEHAPIGMIVCKDKNETVVEYALAESQKPIGVATYKITAKLPKNLQKEPPAPEQVSKLLRGMG